MTMPETTYTRTTVNYQAIVDALMTVTNEAYTRAKEQGWIEPIAGGKLISEFRTVGFTTGRQTGKNNWMVDFYGKYRGETLVLFRDDMHQRMFSSMLNSRRNLMAVVNHVLKAELYTLVSTNSPLSSEQTAGVKFILVDESSHLMERISRSAFNDWVYGTFGAEVMVIHVG